MIAEAYRASTHAHDSISLQKRIYISFNFFTKDHESMSGSFWFLNSFFFISLDMLIPNISILSKIYSEPACSVGHELDADGVCWFLLCRLRTSGRIIVELGRQHTSGTIKCGKREKFTFKKKICKKQRVLEKVWP